MKTAKHRNSTLLHSLPLSIRANWRSLCLFSLIGLAFNLDAQESRSLADDSPFLPPNFKIELQKKQEEQAKPPPPAPKPPPLIEKNLEFKGCMRLRNVWRFSIFDKRSGKSSWVKFQEKSDAGFTVVEFNMEDKSIVVEENGHKETLTIKSPSGAPVPIAHLKAAPKPATPTPNQATPQQPASTPTPKPTPAAPIPRRRIVTPGN